MGSNSWDGNILWGEREEMCRDRSDAIMWKRDGEGIGIEIE